MLGHQIGVLTLLWREKDKITQQHSHFCVYLLMELVFQQKGEWDRQRFRVGGGEAGGGSSPPEHSCTQGSWWSPRNGVR